jgi:integrase
MASIVRKGNCVSIVYYDPKVINPKTGKPKQIWKKTTEENALEDKLKIELELLQGTNLPKCQDTLQQFLEQWITIYGPQNWEASTHTTSESLLRNHVYPELGKEKLQSITPQTMEQFFVRLKKHRRKPGNTKRDPEDMPLLSASSRGIIHQLLRCAFDSAVDWNLIRENPVKTKKPRKGKGSEIIWTVEEFHRAIYDMQKMSETPYMEYMLQLAMICYVSFYDVLRIGECVAITTDSLDFENKTVRIDKTMQRMKKQSVDAIAPESILYVFPEKQADSTSFLALKTPKTEDSVRTNDMYPFLERIFRQRLYEIAKNKRIFGPDYHDHKLIFCQPQGDPIEPKLCEVWFNKWQKRSDLGLEHIVFHRLRHSSISYMMPASGNDEVLIGNIAGHSTEEKEKKQTTYHYTHSLRERRERLALVVTHEEKYYQQMVRGLLKEPSETEFISHLKMITDGAADKQTLSSAINADPSFANCLLKTIMDSLNVPHTQNFSY